MFWGAGTVGDIPQKVGHRSGLGRPTGTQATRATRCRNSARVSWRPPRECPRALRWASGLLVGRGWGDPVCNQRARPWLCLWASPLPSVALVLSLREQERPGCWLLRLALKETGLFRRLQPSSPGLGSSSTLLRGTRVERCLYHVGWLVSSLSFLSCFSSSVE